jgi:hypothetical protein
MTLDHSLERRLTILAKRETVFRFFYGQCALGKMVGTGIDGRPSTGRACSDPLSRWSRGYR